MERNTENEQPSKFLEERLPMASADDEIDLVDLLLTVWQRRWLALATFLVVAGLILFFGLYRPSFLSGSDQSIDSYHTAIQFDWAPVTTPSLTSLREHTGSLQETVSWLFKNKFIPQALSAYQARNPKRDVSLDVTAPNGTNIILLKCSGDVNRQTCAAVIEGTISEFATYNAALPTGSLFRMVAHEITLPVANSNQPKKISTALIVSISIIAGIFIALLSVMLAGFANQVRKRISNQ